MKCPERNISQCILAFTNSKLHILYISYGGVILKRNNFLWIFLGKGFREKCKHIEIALNIIQKQNLVQKNHFPFIIVE